MQIDMLGEALDVLNSSHQMMIENLESTENETKIQGAAIIRDAKKLKAAWKELEVLTRDTNEERFDALLVDKRTCDDCLEFAKTIRDQIEVEQSMKLQIIETEFQMKKKSVGKNVDSEKIDDLRRQIGVMNARHRGIHS
jgi:hypothetical protein